jgi:hypothetical protein
MNEGETEWVGAEMRERVVQGQIYTPKLRPCFADGVSLSFKVRNDAKEHIQFSTAFIATTLKQVFMNS